LLAATIEVGDTVGDGIDAFGFHGNSRSEKRKLYAQQRAGRPSQTQADSALADVLTSGLPLIKAVNNG
jgi:hypothetical protein